jgi:hypothetical protein
MKTTYDSRRFQSQYGSDKTIDKLSKSESHEDRAIVAARHPKYHTELKNDKHDIVRESVAMHAKDKGILDHMIKHEKSHDVMAAIASHGHKDHLDKLVNHEGAHVRRIVANKGHEDHMDKLVHDPESYVREAVAHRGKDKHRDILMHDPEFSVKKNVIESGDVSHHEHMMHDKDWRVRRLVANHSHSSKINDHLLNDPDPSVKSMAQSMKLARFSSRK